MGKEPTNFEMQLGLQERCDSQISVADRILLSEGLNLGNKRNMMFAPIYNQKNNNFNRGKQTQNQPTAFGNALAASQGMNSIKVSKRLFPESVKVGDGTYK